MLSPSTISVPKEEVSGSCALHNEPLPALGAVLKYHTGAREWLHRPDVPEMGASELADVFVTFHSLHVVIIAVVIYQVVQIVCETTHALLFLSLLYQGHFHSFEICSISPTRNKSGNIARNTGENTVIVGYKVFSPLILDFWSQVLSVLFL